MSPQTIGLNIIWISKTVVYEKYCIETTLMISKVQSLLLSFLD